MDRTSSIAAAAQELGLNISTARNWANRVNPVVEKPRSKKTAKAIACQLLSVAFFVDAPVNYG
ncbi:hypothetical protein [Arthrobacter polaris]|uniref:hypothetical protein n=1 Tax=Arthrobacter polaris TaxID=2813727 RepID=UPI001F41DD8D|nr:hypothetical protein [Arthrobacter polaris]UIK88987.1 hypothetical protein J0916_00240 [Arthrobacter polaris]